MSPSPPDSQYLHKTTSYTQIDAMLEKMLFEVEKQEKLFGLDLDVLEPEEPCVNTLELVPSTDALIEVPIKKSIKKPKVYETTQEILIDDDKSDHPYEYVTFNNNNKPQETVDHSYDLIDFGENTGRNLDKIVEDINTLVEAVKEDEACMVLEKDSEDLEKQYTSNFKIDFDRITIASSETLSDKYPDSWNDPNESSDPNDTFIDDDYEVIENKPLSYAYQLHDNRTGNDIWWEGTYRNLSIVPEEDEENLSLLSSCYSNKAYGSKQYTTLISTPESVPLVPSINLPNEEIVETESSPSDSSSTFSTSSDEGTYETSEKVVKAEVKLLVKTSDKGKEAIEIRSVREFMENSPKGNLEPLEENKKTMKERSQTLPSKLSEKFSNITNKFSSLLEKKKSSSYSLLPDTDNIEPNTKEGSAKPSFTLQRLFVRNPEADLVKPGDSNLTKTKELSKSKTELFATSNERFPLEYDPESRNLCEVNKVDLYANIPFYPCYDQYSQNVEPSRSNASTQFVSYPLVESSEIPQAYCDWLPQKEDPPRGKV